jgi:hypothetical protein
LISFVLLLLFHTLLHPFASLHANVVECVTLMTLSILSGFNAFAAARVAGGSDPRNIDFTDISTSLIIITVSIAIVAMIHDKYLRTCKGQNVVENDNEAHRFSNDANDIS